MSESEINTQQETAAEEEFSAAAPPHPGATGTGETGFGDAEAPPAGEPKPTEEESAIQDAIKDLNEAVKSDDTADIRAKTERLQTAFHKVSEAMYERAQAEQAGAGATDGAGAGTNGASAEAEEEVVDAEVVDEQK